MQEQQLLEKFRRKGLNAFTLEELAFTQNSLTWAQDFKATLGEDWSSYNEKAVERLRRTRYNTKWMTKEGEGPTAPLFAAAQRGDKVTLDKFLKLNNLQACIKARDDSEKTCLHHVAKEGHTELTRYLIEKGWAVDTKDKFMATPLHSACTSGQPEVVNVLLEHGADPKARDSLGRTPLLYACTSVSAQVIALLLSKDGTLMDTKDYSGRGALHYAVFNVHPRQVDILRTLLELGLSVDSLDAQKKTPLHHAAEAGKVRAIRVLLKWGASLNVKEGVSGKTPAELAPNTDIRALLTSSSKKEDHSVSMPVIKQPVKEPPSRRPSRDISREKSNPLRDKLIAVLRKIQETGVEKKQHILKPGLYSGAWVEGIVSPGALYHELSPLGPSEAALKIFNVLYPYPHPLPGPTGEEEEIRNFFESPTKENRVEAAAPSHSQPPGEPQIVYLKDDKSIHLEALLEQKNLEIERLQKTLAESSANYQKSLALLPTPAQVKVAEEEQKRVVSVNEVLNKEIIDYKKKIDEQAQFITKITSDLENRPTTENFEELQKKLVNLETDNRALRFRAGQLFLKGIDSKISEPVPVSNEPHLQDIEILERLNSSLKGNPPSLKQRLIDADRNEDSKLAKSEFTSVMSNLSIPPQDIVALCRIVGFRNDVPSLLVDSIVSVITGASASKEELETQLFQRLKGHFKKGELSFEQIFEFMDVNKDGSVSFQEFGNALGAIGMPLGREDMHGVFAVLDSDHNGKISLEEMKQKIESVPEAPKPPPKVQIQPQSQVINKQPAEDSSAAKYTMDESRVQKPIDNFSAANPDIENPRVQNIGNSRIQNIENPHVQRPVEKFSASNAPIENSQVHKTVEFNIQKEIHNEQNPTNQPSQEEIPFAEAPSEPVISVHSKEEKPAPKRVQMTGSIVIGVINGKNFPAENLYCQIMLEGSDKILKTNPSGGPNPKWTYKGKFAITEAVQTSSDIYIEVMGTSGLVSKAYLDWLPAVNFPNCWAIKKNIVTVAPNNRPVGLAQVHIMWVVKSSPLRTGGGDLEIILKDMSGFGDSHVQFELGNVSTTAAAKIGATVLLKDVKAETVPPLKCAFFNANNRDLIMRKNLSMEKAMTIRDWTEPLDVPFQDNYKLALAMKWTPFSKQHMEEEKAATKIQALARGNMARQELPQKSKVVSRRIVSSEDKKYLVIVVDEGETYLVKTHRADDPNVPMYEPVSSKSFPKQDLEQIYKNLNLSTPKSKIVGKKVLKIDGRYYLVVVVDNDQNYAVNVHLVDDPDSPMYEPVYTKFSAKTSLDQIFANIEVPPQNNVKGTLIVHILAGVNIQNLMPKVSLGKDSKIGSVVPPWDRTIKLTNVGGSKAKLSLVEMDNKKEVANVPLDLSECMQSPDKWTEELTVRIHTGIVQLKLLWSLKQEEKKLEIEEEADDISNEDLLKDNKSHIFRRQGLHKNNRYYLVNVTEEDEKLNITLHLADDPSIAMHVPQDTKPLPKDADPVQVIRDLEVSSDHKLVFKR